MGIWFHKSENSFKIINAILCQILNEILVKPLYRDLRRAKKVKGPSLSFSGSVGHAGSSPSPAGEMRCPGVWPFTHPPAQNLAVLTHHLAGIHGAQPDPFPHQTPRTPAAALGLALTPDLFAPRDAGNWGSAPAAASPFQREAFIQRAHTPVQPLDAERAVCGPSPAAPAPRARPVAVRSAPPPRAAAGLQAGAGP